MFQRLFIAFAVGLLSTLSMSSCSNDDDNDISNNKIVVNGEDCKIDYASCSFHKTIYDDLGEFEIPPHGSFTMDLIFDESLYQFKFSIDGTYSSNVINIGENCVDDVDVTAFKMLTSIELSTRYYDEDGNLSISEKGSNYVVVNFNNFSFIKDTGKSETQYTVNGKVKFTDINE